MSQAAITRLIKAQQEMLPLLEFMAPLSDREFVQRTLALANNLDDVEIQKAMYHSMLSGNRGFSETTIDLWIKHGNPPVGQSHRLAALKWWGEIKDERLALAESLDLVMQDAEKARVVLQSKIVTAIANLAIIPTLKWESGSARTEIYYCSKDVAIQCGFALMRLLDIQADLGKALRRCKLPECNRFFLSFPPPGGGPRLRYCPDTDHQLIAARLTGPARTQRSREKARARKAK